MCVYVLEMQDGKVTARDTTMVQNPFALALLPIPNSSFVNSIPCITSCDCLLQSVPYI